MKTLPKEAIECCRPRLEHELNETGVQTAILMGNSAVRSLVPLSEARKGITKLRAGPPRKVSLTNGRELEIVPTFHPAACLRNQGTFPLMLGDVAKAVSERKPVMWYEPSVIVVDDPDEAADRLDEIRILSTQGDRRVPVCVDTESGRDKDVSFGRDDGPFGRILCVGIGPNVEPYEDTVFVFSDNALVPERNRAKLRDLLNATGIDAQNIKYDVGVLMSYLDQDEPFPMAFDTMLASYALYEVGGVHGLKYMGQEILGCPDWDSEIKPFIDKVLGYSTIPRDLLYRYNAFDVHNTRMLKAYFEPLIRQHNLERILAFLMRVTRMLTIVEARGMGFDLARSKEIEHELQLEIDVLEEFLPFNPRSPKQVTEWLSDHGVVTDSTDADHIDAILNHRKTPNDVKAVLDELLRARGVSKLKGTYVVGPQKKLTGAGRVHTTYLVHGTTTGRLSSRGPNLQNIPRSGPIKTQFIPRPGYKLIGVDFAQAELRTLTWLAKDEGMRALFNDPTIDIFTELCRQMIPGFDNMDDDGKRATRTLIKTFAYGVSYGRTAAGIAADPAFHMTVPQAQAQMDLFNAKIPAIKLFQREVIARIHRGEDLVNPFGRHRRFYLITDANRTSVENEAMAYLPQSTASDICLEAACRLTEEGVYIVNLVHDALYVEARPDEADEVALVMDRVMVGVADELTGGYVRFATDYHVGDRWSEV
jgi:DNA polymerase-1